ncbi:MAG: glycosyltransferase family 4 protein [Patescibacteria group bacterium]|jgi:phosphatidylinositol alpha-1,6-mannosyltransferase
MKTLLITCEYPPFKGGVANYYGQLVAHWPEVEPPEVWEIKNSWWRLVPRLFRYWREHPEALVIVGHILPLGTAAWLASRFVKGEYVVVLHGMDFTFAHKKKRKAFLSKQILVGAKKIISANSYVAALVSERYPSLSSKVVVVNPGISQTSHLDSGNQAPFLREKYQLGNKVILLTLGRLVARKGVDYTIKALAELTPAEREGLAYVVVGSGPEEGNWRLLAEKTGVSVIFTGTASENEKWSWLNLCDILIMPSREINGDLEGFGIVYLEANLNGKPVIAGRSGGVSDAVAHGVSGLLVDPEDPAAIALAIKTLSSDPVLREKLGRQGRARALANFSWEKKAQEFYQYL